MAIGSPHENATFSHGFNFGGSEKEGMRFGVPPWSTHPEPRSTSNKDHVSGRSKSSSSYSSGWSSATTAFSGTSSNWAATRSACAYTSVTGACSTTSARTATGTG